MVLIETAKYVSIKRISKLGALGEDLADEWLSSLGCSCARTPRNYPFADMIGAWNGKKYFIGVKARNEMQMGGHDYNESYNIVKISDPKRRVLEDQGRTEVDITRMLWEEVRSLAAKHDATPAWVTVSVLPKKGIYSAYFGEVPDNYPNRSIRMTLDARRNYSPRIENVRDARITPDLLNTAHGQ
jgi:hypothetical protein